MTPVDIIQIQGMSASQSWNNHLQLDTRAVIKNKYMVQKLISVINCFLLFRHVKLLVIGLSMKNNPGLCLNFTKSLATSLPLLWLLFCHLFIKFFTLVVIQVSKLCIHNIEEETTTMKI